MSVCSARLGFLVALAASTLFAAPAASASTIYTVHDSDLPYFVDGTITTDGKIGALSTTDITGWDLSISGAGVTPVTLTELNSIVTLNGSSGDLAATTSALLWDFDSDGLLQFALQQGNFSAFISYDNLFIIGEKFFLGCCVDPGGIPRSDAQSIAATPIPTALLLFAAGLGLLIVFGWTKRHKGRSHGLIQMG